MGFHYLAQRRREKTTKNRAPKQAELTKELDISTCLRAWFFISEKVLLHNHSAVFSLRLCVSAGDMFLNQIVGMTLPPQTGR
jgi:hypothetical protein